MSEPTFFSISNEELEESPALHAGEMILCPQCGWGHIVEEGVSDTGAPALLFYKCGETAYLAGIDGKNVMRRFMRKES